MKNKKISQIGALKEKIIDFLICIPLFDRLDANELNLLSEHMNYFEIKKGDILFREGDKGDYVCFIVDGELAVMKEAAEGKHVVIARLSRGRTIGEMSIIDHTPRSATVKAQSSSTLVILTEKGLETILEKHPKIGIKILKGLARLLSMNMRRTSSQLADYMLTMS